MTIKHRLTGLAVFSILLASCLASQDENARSEELHSDASAGSASGIESTGANAGESLTETEDAATAVVVEPSAGGGENAAGTSPFDELEDLFWQFDRVDDHALAECMHDAGFPQYSELLADSASTDAMGLAAPALLVVHPHELGPYTESQAREFGLAGSVYIAGQARREPGNIMSNDPAYFHAHQICHEDLRPSYSPDTESEIDAIAHTLVQLRYTIQTDFHKRISPPIADLLEERKACVEDLGYETANPEVGRSWEEKLKGYGIRPGETQYVTQDDGSPAQPGIDAPLKPGETRLILSSAMPVPKYYPSAEEVDLALAFVECMEEIDFLQRLEELQIPIRAEVLADYETEILGLRERLDAILAQ